MLGERPGEEIALGLVGKFWRSVIEYASITSAEEFLAFNEPGLGKTIYDLSVRPLDESRTHPAVLPHAHRDDRRTRPPLVPPLLGSRSGLGSAHSRQLAPRVRASNGRARERGLLAWGRPERGCRVAGGNPTASR